MRLLNKKFSLRSYYKGLSSNYDSNLKEKSPTFFNYTILFYSEKVEIKQKVIMQSKSWAFVNAVINRTQPYKVIYFRTAFSNCPCRDLAPL